MKAAWTEVLRRPPPLWAVLAFSLVIWGGEHTRRGLWEPDEARFAYVAGEMRASGSWLVPSRNGECYGHKPPLMFWLINLAAAPAGGHVPPWAARFPSLLGSVLTLFAASRLISAWRSPAAGWITLPILAGGWLFWRTGGMGQIDALLCGLQMSSLSLLFAARRDRRASWMACGAGLLMGLAVLAKGPVGLLVPMLVFLVCQAVDRARPAFGRREWLIVAGAALLPPLLWLVACTATGVSEAYVRELVLDQTVRRAAGSLGHEQNALYFLWHAPLDFLPWTLFVAGAWAALGADAEGRRLRRRLAAWTLTVIVFFTLPASKRSLYILLAFPAAAMMIAAAADVLAERRPMQRLCIGLAVAIACAGGLALLHPRPPRMEGVDGRLLVRGLAGLAALPAAWVLWVSRHRDDPAMQRTVLPQFAVLWALLLALAGGLLLPLLNGLKTPDEIAVASRQHLPPGGRLLIYKMNGEIFGLYSGSIARRLRTPADLREAMRQQGRGLVVAKQSEWERDLTQEFPSARTNTFAMGSKRVVWFPYDLRQP